jgi:hypothetical protein
MTAFVPDSDRTRDADLADWKAFCNAYYEPITRALTILKVPEGEADELAHTFLLKAEEKDFLGSFRAFREREAASGRRALFRNYLYRSLQHHVHDAWRKRTTRSKERELGPEAAGLVPAPPEPVFDPDSIYALDILHQALQALRTHCERTGKPHIWKIFEETFLADEFRGRRRRTRAELLAESGRDDPQFLDNALTTAKRAFRRFVQEVLPRWPGDDLSPSERFTDWMETLRGSSASQFDLLHVAYRVVPHLGDSGPAARSSSLVVPESPGGTPAFLVYEGPALAPDDDELGLLLGFLLEMPLTQWLDVEELAPVVPPSSSFSLQSPFRALRAPSRGAARLGRPLCLLTLFDPTEAESEALKGVDAVGLLVRLKKMAKRLHRRTDHSVPEVFAELIYTAVTVLALARYRVAIHSIGSGPLAVNVRWFLAAPWLDERIRPLLSDGLATLERQPQAHDGS